MNAVSVRIRRNATYRNIKTRGIVFHIKIVRIKEGYHVRNHQEMHLLLPDQPLRTPSPGGFPDTGEPKQYSPRGPNQIL
jgi:hypothetical protein